MQILLTGSCRRRSSSGALGEVHKHKEQVTHLLHSQQSILSGQESAPRGRLLGIKSHRDFNQHGRLKSFLFCVVRSGDSKCLITFNHVHSLEDTVFFEI